MPAATTSRHPSQGSAVDRLSRFFPGAVRVKLPVLITCTAGHAGGAAEKAVIEYGTEREVLFATRLPLEFADTLHLRNADGSLDVPLSVVALQYDNRATAVAARFSRDVSNWIVKP